MKRRQQDQLKLGLSLVDGLRRLTSARDKTPVPGSLAGYAAAMSSAFGAITVPKALSGASSANSSASGLLTVSKALSGSASSAALAAGALTVGKTLVGAALATSIAMGALSVQKNLSGAAVASSVAMGTVQGAQQPAPLVQPLIDWAGGYDSAGSVSPPAYDATMQGSGFTEPAIAGHTAWPHRRIVNNNTHITVSAVSADPSRSGIREVRVYLEGGSVILDKQIVNPDDGTRGYVFKAASRSGLDGAARVTIDVVPYNGKILRLYEDIILDSNGNLEASRDVIYLNSNTGSDLNNGSIGAPVKSTRKAMTFAVNDLKIICSGGDTDEPAAAQGAYVGNLKVPIEFVVAPGSENTFRISRNIDPSASGVRRDSVDNGFYRLGANLVKWTGIHYDPSKFVKITATAGVGSRMIFEGCKILDSYSVITDDEPSTQRLGPESGYFILDNGPFVATDDDQRYYFANCDISTAAANGSVFHLNCTIRSGQDTGYFETWRDTNGNVWYIDSDFNFYPLVELRYHVNYPAAVSSSAVTSTGTGTTNDPYRTTIPLASAPVMVGLTYNATTRLNGDYYTRFLSGALAGQSFPLMGVDATAKTVTLYDPDHLVRDNVSTSDTFTSFNMLHPDFLQFAVYGPQTQGLQSKAKNFLFDGCRQHGQKAQPFFFSARSTFGLGTLAVSGTTGTVSGVTLTRSATAATYDSVNDRTTIVWTGTGTMPTFAAQTRTSTSLKFLSGTLSGQEFEIYQCTSGTRTVILKGNASAVASGDTAAIYQFAIGDFLYIKDSGSNQFQYRQVMAMASPISVTFDEAFPDNASGIVSWLPAKTVRDVAIINSRFENDSGIFWGQFQAGQQNYLLANISVSQNLQFRTVQVDTGFGCKNVTIIDSLTGGFNSDLGGGLIPTRGITIDNCGVLLAEAGSNVPQSATDTEAFLSLLLDADMRPDETLTKTLKANPNTGKPLIPFAADGQELTVASLIGALQIDPANYLITQNDNYLVTQADNYLVS